MFRKVIDSDLKMILEWRNHPSVRKWMMNTETISLQEHLSWFEKHRYSPRKKIYLYEEKGMALGFVQFDIIKGDPIVVEWGFYKAPNAPKGTGSNLMKKAIRFAFIDLDVHEIIGKVVSSNLVSKYLHEKFGFTENKELSIEKVSVYRLSKSDNYKNDEN